MANVFRKNRKATDRDILRLNSLGLSLAAVGRHLSVNPTSITLRLKSLSVKPADTRRAFMEGVFDKLPDSYKDTIADLLEARGNMPIVDYVAELIDADMQRRQHNTPHAII